MDFDDLVENFDGAVFGLLVPLGLLLALALQRWTRRWYQRVCSQFGDIPAKCGLTGGEVAARLLATCGLDRVQVKRTEPLDCYHPWKREIRLRPETHDSASLSAVATAAHEVGHAQHFAEKTWRCRVRSVSLPVCWAMPALVALYAILCFLGVVRFSEFHVGTAILVTCAMVMISQIPVSLPLERDATQRATKLVKAGGVLAAHEQDGFERVLNAAWKTHAAAEVQRWIIFSSIALATAGYLWYWSFQNQFVDEIQAYTRLPGEAMVATTPSPQPSANIPQETGTYAYQPAGWGLLLWLVPLAPYAFVIGFILLVFLRKSKLSVDRKLTLEQQAVQHANAAIALHDEAQHDAAIEQYTRAIELNSKFTLAWHNRGQLYLLTGRLEDALRDFESAVDLAPNFLEAITGRAQARLLQQQEQLGLADLETVLAVDPANAGALMIRAEHWFGREEFERALLDWSEALKAAPDCGDVYRARGLTYYFLRDYQRALRDHSEAIRLNPTDAIAWNNRGAAHLKRGDWAEAAADLREAQKLDPKLANAYRHLAWLQATCPEAEYRDGDEAVANAIRAMELSNGEQGEWWGVLAAAHAEAGDFDQAIRRQEKCLAESTPEDRAELQGRLELYQNGQPWRESPSGDSLAADRTPSQLTS